MRRVAPYITAVEKQARTVAVDVDFADPAEAHGMLVGYSTDVEIVLATRAEVLRVPTGALREGGKVLVVEGDTLVERTLRTGWRTGSSPRWCRDWLRGKDCDVARAGG